MKSLLVAAAAIAAVWMLVLPRLADEPNTRERIEQLEALDVNPAAIRYTELAEFPEVIDRMNRRLNDNAQAYWSLQQPTPQQPTLPGSR